jgi:hypothetical protein
LGISPAKNRFEAAKLLGRLIGVYPLKNIQKTIENGHRNSGVTHEK